MNDWIDNDLTTPSIALVDVMFFDGHIVSSVPPTRYDWGRDAPVLIKKWRSAQPIELEDDGMHLTTGPKPPAHKTEYYQDETGEDWIDECARIMTPEEFRGAMKFVIGKYHRRLGKKDNIIQELTKVADYNNRWLIYENNLKNKSSN